MTRFQFIDCNAGKIRNISESEISRNAMEFIYPAVAEGSGIYEELFYKVNLFEENAGACFQVNWLEEFGESILEGFVNWNSDPNVVWDKLLESYRRSVELPIHTGNIRPEGKFAAIIRCQTTPESLKAGSGEYPDWKKHLETLVISISDILIHTKGFSK